MHSVSLKFLVGILSFSDYYPFGMQMPGRNDPGDGYRYGYQGSEKDSEMKGSGSSYTTHYRQLDPRLGRWLSTDPELAALPHQSPYCSMDNNPVLHNDVNGDRINYNGHRRAVRAARRNDANFAANWTTVRAQYGGRSQSLTLYRDEDVTNSLEDLVIQDNIKSQAHLPDKNDKTNFLYFNAVTGSDQGKYAVFDVTFEEEFDLSTRAQPGENEFSRNISTSMTGEEFDRWDITSQVVNDPNERGFAFANIKIDDPRKRSTTVKGTTKNNIEWFSLNPNATDEFDGDWRPREKTINITGTAKSKIVTMKVPKGIFGKLKWGNAQKDYTPVGAESAASTDRTY